MTERSVEQRLEDVQEEVADLASDVYLKNPSLSEFLDDVVEDLDEAIARAEDDTSIDVDGPTLPIYDPRRWF